MSINFEWFVYKIKIDVKMLIIALYYLPHKVYYFLRVTKKIAAITRFTSLKSPAVVVLLFNNEMAVSSC